MTTISDIGISVPAGGTGILQPIVRPKPYLIFTCLSEEDIAYLRENMLWAPHATKVINEVRLTFQLDDIDRDISKRVRLFGIVKQLTHQKTNIFLTPHVDDDGNARDAMMFFDYVMIDHRQKYKEDTLGSVPKDYPFKRKLYHQFDLFFVKHEKIDLYSV